MGLYQTPAPVKLIIAVLLRNAAQAPAITELLCKNFGPLEEQLGPFPFTWTHYYQDELGQHPQRLLLGFEELIPRENLVQIKRLTNQIEEANRDSQGRSFNLDPGVLSLGQFFLATTKDQRHRIYLGQGIFGEVTLYFKDNTFNPFYWTYRDYKSEEYQPFFKEARYHLAYRLKTGRIYGSKS